MILHISIFLPTHPAGDRTGGGGGEGARVYTALMSARVLLENTVIYPPRQEADSKRKKGWKRKPTAFRVSVMCGCMCVLSHFSHVQLFLTLWTAAHQAPLSLRFSRQEYKKGLPRPPPGDLPDPSIQPKSQVSCTGRRGLKSLVLPEKHLYVCGALFFLLLKILEAIKQCGPTLHHFSNDHLGQVARRATFLLLERSTTPLRMC